MTANLNPPAFAPLPYSIIGRGEDLVIIDAGRGGGLRFRAEEDGDEEVAHFLVRAANAARGLQRDLAIALGEISRMTMRPAAEIIEAQKEYEGRLEVACTERNKLRVERAGLIAERDAANREALEWRMKADFARDEVARLQAEVVKLRIYTDQILPRCMGRWVKGSGGHRVYGRDCVSSGRWNVGMGWVCDDHKADRGDCDAWTVEAELDLLRDAVEHNGRGLRAEQVLMANAQRDTAIAEVEKYRMAHAESRAELTTALAQLHDARAELERMRQEAK